MDVETFTILTYNLDSREYNYENRLKSFLSYIKSHPADVIVIQEGTRLTFELLMREMGLLGYKRFLPDIMHHRRSGEIIFSKFPISQMKHIAFKNSTDNRGLTLAKIDIWGKEDIWIVTTQLDEKISLKRQQLLSIPSLLNSIQNETIVFGGDVQIMNYQDDDLIVPDGWHDAWYEGGKESHKYTLNSNTNLLASPPLKDRPDRVWFKLGKGSKIECIKCRLYGYDSETAISSHYGVLVTFRFCD